MLLSCLLAVIGDSVVRGSEMESAFLFPKKHTSATATKSPESLRCRCTDPSAACWPKLDLWQELNRSVEGRLFRSEADLPQEAIFSSPSNMSDFVNPKWNPLWIQNRSELSQNTGGFGRDGWSTAVSTYYVAVESLDHIAAAVKFATDNNLRLVVKGAGHDYLGRSTAPNSLLIWTQHLQKIEWNNGNETVTVQAGVIWEDVYLSAQQRGRHVVGGSCVSVGAVGGYALGGGFGEHGFSRRDGMAAENIVNATVINAMGEVLVVNATSNPDLFWALRGGGGGTFGVVFNMTYRSAPLPREAGVVSASITLGNSTQAELSSNWLAFTAAFVAFVNSHLLTQHWGGTYYPAKIGSGWTDPFLPFMFFWDIPSTEAHDTFASFNESLQHINCSRCVFEWMMTPGPLMTLHGEKFVKLYPDFMYGATAPAEGRAGQFIPKNYFSSSTNHYSASYFSAFVPMQYYGDARTLALKLEVAAALNPFMEVSTGKAMGGEVHRSGQRTSINTHTFQSGSLLISWFFFQGYWPGRKSTREALSMLMSLTDPIGVESIGALPFRSTFSFFAPLNITYPDWCIAVESLTDIQVDLCWGAVDEFVDRASQHFRTKVNPQLRDLFPKTGSYASEADYYGPDWQHQFWGDNYARLYSIKKKVDPTGLFVCHHCVGSEDWSSDGNCHLPVRN